MTCPSLESWLEALDETGGVPDGSHPDCEECGRTEACARELLEGIKSAVPVSHVSDPVFVRRLMRHTYSARRLFAVASASIAAAAAVVLALKFPRPSETEESPVARGMGANRAASTCDIAELTADGLRFLRDGDHLPEGSQLAFRVRNPGPEERWLGIFAVTATADVAWYYPAYERPEDDVQTLPLRAAEQAQILRESVAMPLGTGPVRLICWQTDHPSRVRDVDALVEKFVSGKPHPERLARIEALSGEQGGIILWFDSRR